MTYFGSPIYRICAHRRRTRWYGLTYAAQTLSKQPLFSLGTRQGVQHRLWRSFGPYWHFGGRWKETLNLQRAPPCGDAVAGDLFPISERLRAFSSCLPTFHSSMQVRTGSRTSHRCQTAYLAGRHHFVAAWQTGARTTLPHPTRRDERRRYLRTRACVAGCSFPPSSPSPTAILPHAAHAAHAPAHPIDLLPMPTCLQFYVLPHDLESSPDSGRRHLPPPVEVPPYPGLLNLEGFHYLRCTYNHSYLYHHLPSPFPPSFILPLSFTISLWRVLHSGLRFTYLPPLRMLFWLRGTFLLLPRLVHLPNS